MGDTVDYKRQSALANPRLLSELNVHVIGVGTVGSNAAYHLARLGIKRIHLHDADKVEPHNLPSQQFDFADIGRLKVNAAEDQIERIAPDCKVFSHPEFADGTEDMSGIVILGLDSMSARRDVFNLCCENNPTVKLVVDIRMAGNTSQAFALDPCDATKVKGYRLFDFDDDHAAELPCGGESVSYVGPWSGVVASNIVRQHVMGEDFPFSVTVDFGKWDFKFPKL